LAPHKPAAAGLVEHPASQPKVASPKGGICSSPTRKRWVRDPSLVPRARFSGRHGPRYALTAFAGGAGIVRRAAPNRNGSAPSVAINPGASTHVIRYR
jgi:hypothetical protein